MNSKPMSYDSLKVLMQYVSSKKRMEISSDCPTLRNMEKIVPLRLEFVALGDSFTLDDTKFKLDVVRKCPEGVPVPRCFRYGFDAVRDTLDPHGYPDIEDRISWTPGDIVRKHFDEREPQEVADRIAALQERIGGLRAQLPEGGGTLDDLNKIEYYEIFLQALKNRQNNILSPYTLVYRLRVIENGQETHCFYSEVDMKFSLKLKQLATFLFAGRRDPIRVRELVVYDGDCTIHMPPGRLFKAHHLSVPRIINNVIVGESALHESSFPLEELTVDEVQPHDFNCPIVRDAKHFKITYPLNQPVVNFVIENYHPCMSILKVPGGSVSFDNVVEIVMQARAQDRKFSLTLEFDTPPDFMHRWNDFKKRFHATQIEDYLHIFIRRGLSYLLGFDRTPPFQLIISSVGE